MLLGKSVLKICSKFTEEHPCRSVISIEIALQCGCPEVFLGKGVLKLCSKFTGEHHGQQLLDNENEKVENQGYNLANMKSYCKSCNPMKNIHKMSHLKCIYFINLRYFSFDRSSRPEVFCKKISACNFSKKEILAQVFCCEFCEIFKNTFL